MARVSGIYFFALRASFFAVLMLHYEVVILTGLTSLSVDAVALGDVTDGIVFAFKLSYVLFFAIGKAFAVNVEHSEPPFDFQ